MTIIFPIAAPTSGPESKFRPFLPVDGGQETLIQAAFGSFSKVRSLVDRVIFVSLAEHEAKYNVKQKLGELLPDVPFELWLLDAISAGPYDTVAKGLRGARLSGSGIICDCDHALDLEPFFQRLRQEFKPDCLVPTWCLRGESLQAWSVAAVDESGKVTAIAEKNIPGVIGQFVGVIGCTYFRDMGLLLERVSGTDHPYVSDAIRSYLAQGMSVESVLLERASFFGSEARRESVRASTEHTRATVFCDLDGTLIEHPETSGPLTPPKVLPGTLKKLQSWRDTGLHIVITSSRPQSDERIVREILEREGIEFEQIIFGLPLGPRFIINERNPAQQHNKQAHAIEIERNRGIGELELPGANACRVVKRFSGGSMAETLLLEEGGSSFIRKRVSKRANLSSGYGKLKQQYRTLERFTKLNSGLVPRLYAELEDSFEYYFDMEYLANHSMLCRQPVETQASALDRLLGQIEESIYSHRLPGFKDGNEWLRDHITAKIFPKLELLQQNRQLARLVSGRPLRISGELISPVMPSLERLMDDSVLSRYAPDFLCMIHGDLTYSNILLHAEDIRLIDMDATVSYEAPGLDLGKLFQSLLGGYEKWEHRSDLLIQTTGSDQLQQVVEEHRCDEDQMKIVLNRWARILGRPEESVRETGMFYMGLHFVRMVPYRLNISENQALFALACAAKWLGRLAEPFK